jgi:hypothetical protein
MKHDHIQKVLQKKLIQPESELSESAKPRLVIVSPALASANNGNWQTAKRYRQLLNSHFRVRLVDKWDGAKSDVLMLALHARRSYDSIAAWHDMHGANGLVTTIA